MTTNPESEPLPSIKFWTAFEMLKNDLVSLHADWQLFDQLYGVNEARVQLLNASAGDFFHRLFWIMLRDITIGICRLLDPPATGSNRNLVLKSLVHDLDEKLHASSKRELIEKLKGIRDTAKALTKLRHKRVAHRDRLTAEGTMGSPEVSRGLFASVLEGMGEYLNVISVRFRETTLVFEVAMLADGSTLVRALQRADAFQVLIDEGAIPRDSIRKNRHPEAGRMVDPGVPPPSPA